MFVHGPAGTGKTCAALVLCDHVDGSIFWTEEQLCHEITEAMMDRLTNSLGYSITPQQIWRKTERSPLVVLDELGARSVVSDHRYAVIKTLLDRREAQPFVIVSNLPPADLPAAYDDRIASRALAGTIVRLGGVDRRRP